jgi:hypothetical protein
MQQNSTPDSADLKKERKEKSRSENKERTTKINWLL